MGFRFPLATLLRLREIAEQREERLLAQIQNQIALSHRTLADLEVQRRSLCDQRELALRQATSGFDIVNFYAQVSQIDTLEVSGKEHLAKLLTLRDQQMKIYETAHRNMELLSGMKTERLVAFRTEQARQEQNLMDDSFSSRSKRI